MADDAWDIATSLLVDVASGGMLFGLFLIIGAWLQGEGERATALRRASAHSFREHPGAVDNYMKFIMNLRRRPHCLATARSDCGYSLAALTRRSPR